MIPASVNFFLDTRRVKKDGTYNIKIRLIVNRKSYDFSTEFNCTETEWHIINQPKPKKELKPLKDSIDELRSKAMSILKELTQFSSNSFKNKFFNTSIESKKDNSLKYWFEEYINNLKKQNRIKTALSYNNAWQSIQSFQKGLQLIDITVDFLSDYEIWMLKKNKSKTTIGIYLRSLRTIINNAISERHLESKQYPFGKRKFTIPKGRNIKKALSREDVQKIMDYPLEEFSSKTQARDLWVLTYLLNGANMKDICLIEHQDININILTLRREKTKNTNKNNSKEIKIFLNDYVLFLINKYASKSAVKGYVFPFINNGDNEETIIRKVSNLIKNTNKYLGDISDELGLLITPTTYHARHSFATHLKNSGAPIAFISEQLGHSTEMTTKSYLNSFDLDIKKQWTEMLVKPNLTK